MKSPKKFFWKVTSKDKPLPGTVVCQEQCSSGGGGGGQCCGQCGGGKNYHTKCKP